MNDLHFGFHTWNNPWTIGVVSKNIHICMSIGSYSFVIEYETYWNALEALLLIFIKSPKEQE